LHRTKNEDKEYIPDAARHRADIFHRSEKKCGVLFVMQKAANFFLKGKNAERGICSALFFAFPWTLFGAYPSGATKRVH